LVDGKPAPVVVHAAVDHPVVLPQLEVGVGGCRMFGDVREALLHDPIESRLDRRRQPFFERAVHADVQPRARGHPVHKASQGGEEA
jgi:hypothetical protein